MLCCSIITAVHHHQHVASRGNSSITSYPHLTT